MANGFGPDDPRRFLVRPDVQFSAGGDPLRDAMRALYALDGSQPGDIETDVSVGMNQIARSNGAPTNVRGAVAQVRGPESRLRVLRQFYPQAVRVADTDQMIYLDQDGRPQVFDEDEASWRDIIDVIPAAAQIVGGTIGGISGAGTGIIAAGGTPAAIPAAIGLGAGGAAATGTLLRTGVEEVLANVFPMPEGDPRTPRQRGAEMLATAAEEGIGGAIGDAAAIGITRAGPRAARMLMGRGTEVAEAAGRLNIPVTAGQAIDSPVLQRIEENVLPTVPFAGGRMQRASETTLEAMRRESDRIASGFGDATPTMVAPREAAGRAVKQGIEEISDNFNVGREALASAMDEAIGPRTMAGISNTQALLPELQAELAAGGQNLAPAIAPTLDRINALIATAQQNGGAVQFRALRTIRSIVGEQLDAPDITGRVPTGGKRYLRRLYGSISEDLHEAARQMGPDASNALRAHDEYVARFRETGNPLSVSAMNRVMAGTDKAAYSFALQGDLPRLNALLSGMSRETRDEIAANIWYDLGVANPGSREATNLGELPQAFSPSTFLRRWHQLGPAAQQRLFAESRPELIQPINDLVRVAGAGKAAQGIRNHSNTSKNVVGALLGANMIGGEPAASAGLTAAATGAAGLLTSPRFVKWLTTSTDVLNRSPNALPSLMIRLRAIAQLEPEIAEEIERRYLEPYESGRLR